MRDNLLDAQMILDVALALDALDDLSQEVALPTGEVANSTGTGDHGGPGGGPGHDGHHVRTRRFKLSIDSLIDLFAQ